MDVGFDYNLKVKPLSCTAGLTHHKFEHSKCRRGGYFGK